MGSVVSSLFGGSTPSYEPEPAQYIPAPSTESSEAESAATRDAERKKNRARAGGIRSTLLSNPLGSASSLGGNSPLGGLGS